MKRAHWAHGKAKHAPHAADTRPAAEATVGNEAKDELVRQAAYYDYEARGRVGGHELDDWLKAEAEFEWLCRPEAGDTGATGRRIGKGPVHCCGGLARQCSVVARPSARRAPLQRNPVAERRIAQHCSRRTPNPHAQARADPKPSADTAGKQPWPPEPADDRSKPARSHPAVGSVYLPQSRRQDCPVPASTALACEIVWNDPPPWMPLSFAVPAIQVKVFEPDAGISHSPTAVSPVACSHRHTPLPTGLPLTLRT